MSDVPHPADFSVSRRSLLSAIGGAAAFGASAAATGVVQAAPETKSAPTGKRYDFKKSINQWAFPYPQKMSLEQCLEFIDDDELVEITPAAIRVRKKILDTSKRRVSARQNESED